MNDRDCENCIHRTKKGCEKWNCEFERKVTRKEAIKVFKDMKKGVYPFDPNVYLDIAINSLEIYERYELEYENAEDIHREKEQAYMQGYEDACKKYRQEPKIGQWMRINYSYVFECSECGQNVMASDICAYRYCHGCGVKMESEV